MIGDITMTETTVKKSPFSELALKAMMRAQSENPTKSLDMLVTEVSAIFEELKAAAKGVNGDAYTRATAIAEILKVTPDKKKEDVIAEADAVYCAKTKRESNVRETTFTFAHVYHTLLVFGLVGTNPPNIVLPKPEEKKPEEPKTKK
jgi:uncharacterized protein (DUF2147 family)